MNPLRFSLALLAMATPHLANAQAAAGAQIFKQRCQACHSSAAVAPNLKGIVGRKAASAKFNYSAALTASKLVWTRDKLSQFLAAPAKLVPGTRMVVGVADPVQRAALIDYLATLK